jgi:phage-related protein
VTAISITDGEDTVVVRPALPGANDGVFCRSYDFGFPAPREASYLLGGIDGAVDNTTRHGSREVSLELRLVDTTSQTRHELADIIRKLFHPSKRPVMSAILDGWPSIRYMTLRGVSIAYAPGIGNVEHVDLGIRAVAPLGLWESPEFASALAEATETEITNSGTAPTPPTFDIDGPVTDIDILVESALSTYRFVIADLDGVGVDDTVTVDCASRAVTLAPGESDGVETSLYAYVDWATSVWPVLDYGPNQVTVTTVGGATARSITWKDRWV